MWEEFDKKVLVYFHSIIYHVHGTQLNFLDEIAFDTEHL